MHPTDAATQDAALAIAFEGLAIHAEGRLLAVNAAFAEVLGDDPQALIGRSVASLFKSDGWARLSQSPPGTEVPASAWHADGRAIRVALRQRPIRREGRPAVLLGLQAAAERPRVDVEAWGDVVALLEREGTFVYASPSVRDGLGYEPEALIGGSIWGLIHPDDAARLRAARDAAANGARRGLTFRLCHADGRYRWVEARSRLISGMPFTSEPVFLLEWRDVTALTEAQAALNETRERLSFVVDHLPMVLFALDERGVFTLSEGRGLARLGLRPGEVVGLSMKAVYADEPGVLEGVRRALAGEAFSRVGEMQNGSAWETRYMPVFDEAGRLISVVGVASDIIDRRRAEAERQESEARYRRLVENMPDIVARLTPEGRFLYYNEAVTAATGQPPSWFVGKTPREAGYDEAICLEWDAMIERLAAGEPIATSMVRYEAIGGERWFEVRFIAERDAHGALESVLGIARDLTALRQAESARRDADAKLRAVVAHARDLIYMRDYEGRYVLGNQALADFFGRPLDQVIGRRLEELASSETAASMRGGDKFLLSGEAEALTEDIAVGADGVVRTFLSAEYPYHDADGRLVGLIGFARDITERKRAELELAALYRQHELILNSAGEGIYGLDAEGVVTFINPAAARMLGFEPAELVGQRVRGAARQPFASLGFPLENGFIGGHEEVLWRRDGTSFIAWCTVTPIEEEGSNVGAVITFSDIGPRKRTESELRAANRELYQLSQLKDEFLSTVSHELRTPLAAIRNAVAILGKQKAGPLNELQARFMAMVSDHVLRLNRLVDDILDFQKLEAGSMTFRLAEGDLRPLVLEVTNNFSPVFAEKSQHVAIALPETPLLARFDPDKLGQVLLNLYSNAAKFTPEGGSVWVEGDTEDGEVRLRVRDNGQGVLPHDLLRIFDKFVQADASLTRRAGGTGLGLAISKHIIECGHGGRIWAESAPGGGTTVHLALPAVAINPDPLRP